MTRLICRDCGQVHKAPFKPERQDFDCQCGGRRALPSELKPRNPLRRTAEQDEWTVIDAAHLWSRSRGGCDVCDCVIPLCRTCHIAFDGGDLDLLPKLIDRGYQAELAHPILEHGVSLTPLLERVTGQKWAPVETESLQPKEAAKPVSERSPA